MTELLSGGTGGNGPLMHWVNAITHSLRPLADTMGIETFRLLDETAATDGQAGNYIYLYGEQHAYQIGILGTMADFSSVVKSMVSMDQSDTLCDDDVYDGIGEIVNILVGNVKTAVRDHFQNLSLGLPMMTTGAIVYPRPDESASIRVQLDTATVTFVVNIHPLPNEVRKQRLLEQEVRDREARLKSILDTAADAILTIDDEGRIESMNNAAEHIFRATVGSLIHQSVSLVLPDLMAILAEASSATDHDGRSRELIGVRNDGEEFPVEVSYSNLSTGGGQIRIVIARDITQRKKLEAVLGQSKRMDAIGQLAAGIAHEINTPIQYVGDNAQFLKESFDDIFALLGKYEVLKTAALQGNLTPQLMEEIAAAEAGVDMTFLSDEIPLAITQALEGVERVASIVAAMKAFSHPGKEKCPADINKALQTTITVCRNEWKFAAEMTTDFDETLPMVFCVLGEVNQVFMNIIVNAAHAIVEKNSGSGALGMITVTTEQAGAFAEIRISDTGNGIPAGAREKVFEPFFTTKEVGKGTGQGLSIAHSIIVKKHAGALAFETAEGKGTTFIIRLPLDPPVKG